MLSRKAMILLDPLVRGGTISTAIKDLMHAWDPMQMRGNMIRRDNFLARGIAVLRKSVLKVVSAQKCQNTP